MKSGVRLLGCVLLPLVVFVAACPSDPCPPGQQLREERFPDRFQLRSKGCVDRAADGSIRSQGAWVWFYETGQREAEGAYLNGLENGATGETGIPRSGRHGPWIFWHPNGQPKQQGTYRDGKLDGQGLEWFENGQKKLEGTFKNGQQEGRVTTWYADGQRRSEAGFKAGQPHGRWTFWHENGQREREGTFLNGTQEGDWTVWDARGEPVDAPADVDERR